MRKSVPISVIVHYPTTKEDKKELARRVTSVQADFVTDTICNLNCPSSQKLSLLNAVIESARHQKKARMNKENAAELSL